MHCLPSNWLSRTSGLGANLGPRVHRCRGRRDPSNPTSPFWSTVPEDLLPVGRRLRGFPRCGPCGRGCVPGLPLRSVPRPALAGFFPNSLFTRAMVPEPVSVQAGVSVPPPVPVPIPPLAPVSLPAPVLGSIPLSLRVAVSVRARVPVWVPLSRPDPGLASPRRKFHGPIPCPRPGATRGQQSTTSFPGRWPSPGAGRGAAGRDWTGRSPARTRTSPSAGPRKLT